MPTNTVVLVDELDHEIGTEEKLKAHVDGKLHRAFSVFIFNSKNELLLQQRAQKKYHSGGLWTNTVCGHPNPGEDLDVAAKRRMTEEMGFTAPVKEIFSFVYKSDYENGLTEHEFDHVFFGRYDGEPKPNPEEVMAYKWIAIAELNEDVARHPGNYTTWFKMILKNNKFLKAIA